MKKKLSKERPARTKADSKQKDEDMQVSPAIAKPNVVCSQSPLMLVSKHICDVDAYLKKVNQYIEKCNKESG
ncbi:MAG: hypothetical protein IT255_00110 [Chitinophagaceae bacterium]|nr:hypothetical protein [Chitinophagaceae bacterium]